MGNSHFGQHPSQSWQIIVSTVLKPDKKNKCYLDLNKYDLLTELRKVIELEKQYYDLLIRLTKHQGKKEICPDIDQVIRDLLQGAIKMEEMLTKYWLNDDDESKQEREEDKLLINDELVETCKNNELNYIECDTSLLDITLGKLQCDLAEDMISTLTAGGNEYITNLLREKWSEKDEDCKSSRYMQGMAVNLVNPCKEAAQNWWNWSIL